MANTYFIFHLEFCNLVKILLLNGLRYPLEQAVFVVFIL